MIRALIGSLCAAIVVLAITAICLWGWGQKNVNKAIQADRSLEVEKGISSDLRTNLETAQNSNSALTEQLQHERELVQTYQAKSKNLNSDLLTKQDQVRILEREDKTFSDWGNTALPNSIVGMLNQVSTKASHRNQN